jgi:hypothetical protein
MWWMTEKKWLAGVVWGPLYQHLRNEGRAVSDRKMRLFAASCLRRLWPVLSEKGRRATDVVERLADGQVGGKELHELQGRRPLPENPADRAAHWALVTGNHVAAAIFKSLRFARQMTSTTPLGREEDRHWADLFRDMVGNPFRPISFEPSWRTSTVKSVAQNAYDDRVLPAGLLHADALAVLADALEDAGCTNADVLTHLRGPGPHARGCWVVDHLMSKK